MRSHTFVGFAVFDMVGRLQGAVVHGRIGSSWVAAGLLSMTSAQAHPGVKMLSAGFRSLEFRSPRPV